MGRTVSEEHSESQHIEVSRNLGQYGVERQEEKSVSSVKGITAASSEKKKKKKKKKALHELDEMFKQQETQFVVRETSFSQKSYSQASVAGVGSVVLENEFQKKEKKV